MKSGILLICFWLLTVFGFSQTLNLRFGPCISTMDWHNTTVIGNIYDKNNIGINFILGLDYLDFKYFNLSTNLGYIQKGGSGSSVNKGNISPEPYAESEIHTKLNYITVNTVFEAKIPVMEMVIPFIHVGPRLDYLISYSDNVQLFSQFTEVDELNKTMYGVIGGGGVDFRLSKFKVGLVFDYFWNINKLVDYKAITGATHQIDIHAFSVNAQVGYTF
ncbi:MAG: outer membrane beta-barrel protein [Bacteroidales bacterium]